NLSGHLALTVPVELDCGGLKVGLQIVGRKGQDELVCAFGAQLQQSTASERLGSKSKS
ncbi:amidase, partial [Pseudomonas fluorescens]